MLCYTLSVISVQNVLLKFCKSYKYNHEKIMKVFVKGMCESCKNLNECKDLTDVTLALWQVGGSTQNDPGSIQSIVPKFTQVK